MFDDMSIDTVVWDEEPQQLDGWMDDPLECKHTMFKAARVSNSDAQKVFDAMPSVVFWDEEMQPMVDQHGLLKELAHGGCHIGENKFVSKAPVALNRVVHEVPSQVVWDDDTPINLPSHECLLQFDRDTVTWDEEMLHNVSSHAGLLQKLASGSNNLDTPNELLQQLIWDEELLQGPNTHDGLLQQESQSDVIWDQELLHSPESHGLLLQLADGDELLLVQQEAGFDECLLADKRTIIDLVINDLIPHDNDMDNVKLELAATNCQVSACEFSESETVVLGIRQETIVAGKIFTEMPCQEDTQVVEQVVCGGSAHVLFTEISPNEMATTHLEQAVFVISGVSEGDVTEVLVQIFGQMVCDEMPAAIGAPHGLLQHLTHSGAYFGEEKKVESVDPMTSQGASHVMFLVMPFMDLFWDDDMLGGYEYREQAKSKIAAMSSICANLNKQKMDGLSKLQVQELQVYLDNSEVFAELHNRVVWDSQIQPSMDKYEGMSQQQPLGVDIRKGLALFWMSDFSPRERARWHNMCFLTILILENLKSAVLVQIQNYVLHPSLCLRKCCGVQNSMLWCFASFGRTYLLSLQTHCCGLHHGEMQKLIVEDFLQSLLNDFSSSLLCIGSGKPQLACGKTYLAGEMNKRTVWLGDDKVLTPGHGACSRHEMKHDCNHLVIFDEEQGVRGAHYVINESSSWRRSAFSSRSDDVTVARSVFHQISSWNPNDVSPWSFAWFCIAGLQKFQHSDHSDHKTTDVSKYDLERMLCSGCLNVPWDPGGNHDCFILAIAWGQAMFYGGGNVIPGTIGYMGWDIIGFGPCIGLASYTTTLDSSHKGKRQKAEGGKKKNIQKHEQVRKCSSSS